MKVLIVHPRFATYGGAELVIVKLIKYLKTQGVEVGVLTTDAVIPTKDLLPELITSLVHPEPNRLGGVKGEALALASGVRKHAKDYNVINIHNFPATFAIPFAGKTPVVWMCNEPELYLYSQSRKYLKPLLAMEAGMVRSRVRKAVVPDSYSKSRLMSNFTLHPNRIKMVPYGVDYNFWAQGTRQSEEGLRLLQVGQISPFKNQIASLKVLKLLLDSPVKVERLVLAGSLANEAYYSSLRKYCRKYIPSGYVEFMDHISHEGVRDLYYESDVLLHPVKPQGGWLTPFDAMCTGLPVVVSPNFTGSELIRENRLGYVCPTVNRAVEVIQSLGWSGPGFSVPIHETAVEWVQDNLTWEKYCQGMLETLEEVA